MNAFELRRSVGAIRFAAVFNDDFDRVEIYVPVELGRRCRRIHIVALTVTSPNSSGVPPRDTRGRA
jgi:hypothetical protein